MPSDPFGNPYKFRLWFGQWSPGVFTARQSALVLHFLSYGKRGCDSWNYKLARQFGCSIRTLQRDLRRLELYNVILIDGAWGKHRRIRVVPLPKMRLFFQWAFQQMLKKQGDKFVTHQRRSYSTYRNRGKDTILYGDARLVLEGTELPPVARAFLTKRFVDKWLNLGFSRERAIIWAEMDLQKRFSKMQGVKKDG